MSVDNSFVFEQAKILIVDDDPFSVEIIMKILEGQVEDIETCSSGNEVEGRAREDNPNLVLLDWELTDPSGLDVLKSLKADEELNHIPVIILTSAKKESDAVRSAMEEGAMDFLKKPVDALELSARVKSAVKISAYYQKIIDQKNEQEALMSIVAHDLKAPFGNILNIIPFLEDPNEETRATFMKHLKNAVKGGLNLILDLLTVNSLEKSREKVSLEKINLAEFFEEFVMPYNEEANKKEIKLHTKVDDYDWVVHKGWFTRISDNLLTNAIKFTKPNKDKNVYLACVEDGDHIKLTIKDEGRGIKEEEKGELFKKFSKLSARPTAGESSSGLGLYIVKLLIEKLKGSIEVESEWKKGSEFIIRFPKNISLPES